MSISDFSVKELAKAGTLFLVMGAVIWFQRADYQSLDSKLEVYRIETRKCSAEYQRALMNQLGRSNDAINSNNKLIRFFKDKWEFLKD